MENNRAGKQDIPDQARSRRERVHENERPKRNRIVPPNTPLPSLRTRKARHNGRAFRVRSQKQKTAEIF